MCGIAGCYQQVDGEALARRMGDRLVHRGPDEGGFYTFADERVAVQLAHRRLSIIDLAKGQQPFVKDGLSLSYNGELYNYREIRTDLVARGVRFATDSDTEVMLEAWRMWGPGCLRKLRGMFAFSVFDEASGSLFLVRDQLGIKPLHYLRRKDGVVFASELKALVDVFSEELRVDPGAMVASILYYWVPDRRCTVRDVKKLQPGTWAEFRPDGSCSVRSYWDAAEAAAAAASGPPVDLREVIESSVAAHVVADVPVATFLSGGLDSSIVSVLARRQISDLQAYTITFRSEDRRLEAMPDDARYARMVAKAFDIRLAEIEVHPDVVDLLPRMVGILDEPVGDPAALNTLLMCEAAREAGAKVVLSGMGADELFGGYRKHLACVMSARYQRLPAGARSALNSVVSTLPVKAAGQGLRYARWAKRFLTFSDLSEEAAFRRSYSLYDPCELAALVGPDLRPLVDDVVQEHFEIYQDNQLTEHVNRMCLADARHFLPGLNLAYTDRASMAASTEVRTPFVDPVVFRGAFSLTSEEKIHRRRGKVALKNAARSWLPGEIVDRPKASFSVPLRSWIDNDLREVVDDTLVRGELVSSGFLSREVIDQLIADERSGREDRSKHIWQLLTLETWYRQVRSVGVAL